MIEIAGRIDFGLDVVDRRIVLLPDDHDDEAEHHRIEHADGREEIARDVVMTPQHLGLEAALHNGVQAHEAGHDGADDPEFDERLGHVENACGSERPPRSPQLLTSSASALSKIFGALPPKRMPSFPPICLRSSMSSSRSAAAFSNSRFAAASRILRSRSRGHLQRDVARQLLQLELGRILRRRADHAEDVVNLLAHRLRLDAVLEVVCTCISRRRRVSPMARAIDSVTTSAYMITLPSTLREARPIV